MEEFVVLTTKGNTHSLPLLNSVLEEGEEVIVTNSDGGFLATVESEEDFTWHALSEIMESDEEYAILRVNTVEHQLNYYKTVLHDALQKIEFLEKLSGG